MADFKDLDPDTRCYALVGQFLQAWSAMELSLRDAIGAALSIEVIKLQIICSNMRFRDKTNILRTLIDVSSLEEEVKTSAKSELKKLADFSVKRNMVAHDPFGPDKSKTGVEFMTVKAKGTFDTPNVVWTPQQFEEEIRVIGEYAKGMNELQKGFEQKPLSEKSYVDALIPFIQTDWPVPMRRTMSPALLNSLSPFPLTLLDSDPATPKTSPQIPEKPVKDE